MNPFVGILVNGIKWRVENGEKKDVRSVLTSSGYGAISSITPVKKAYRTSAEREVRTAVPSSQSKYDSVTLTSAFKGESRFPMDLVSRLSQEVRTATTTGDIHTHRQEVAADRYTPNPMAIAGRILFLGEGG